MEEIGQSPPPGDRCWFGQETFARTRGNERDAPKAAVRLTLAGRFKSAPQSGH
jgi:hypothetical protein